MVDSTDTTVALVGNSYFEYPLSVHREEGFLKIVELLRGSSAALANLECTIQDREDWPAFGAGMGWAGTYMGAPPSMIDDLKFMGIKAVFAANNHAGDFGEGGVLTTIKHLRRSGMFFAGIGASLKEASEPCYVETGNLRIAIVSAVDWGPRQSMELSSPWPAGYMPTDELPPLKSRPGLNLVRYEAVVHVDRDAFDQLRRISAQLGWEKKKAERRLGGARSTPHMGPTMLGYETDTETEFFFMGRKFVLDNEFRISTFAFQEDLDRIYKHVHEAQRQADVVIMAFHDQAHGGGVPDFIRTLAHGAIDAGANIYVNHGSLARGIELYKGKAILYGLSGFFMHNDQVKRQPGFMLRRMGLRADSGTSELIEQRERNRDRAVVSGAQPYDHDAERFILIIVFSQQGELKEIRIHPIQHTTMPGARLRKVVPVLTEPGSEVSEKVLKRAVEHSEQFGTTVEIRDGIGVVRVK